MFVRMTSEIGAVQRITTSVNTTTQLPQGRYRNVRTRFSGRAFAIVFLVISVGRLHPVAYAQEKNGAAAGDVQIPSLPDEDLVTAYRHDLAAMGRVWYVESWARSRFGDAEGLLDGLHRVAAEGRDNGYFWRERYYPSSSDAANPAGAEKYCEYPANLIRIVNRFLLGIELRLDGSILLAPNATRSFWDRGFGHTLRVRQAVLKYRLRRDEIDITFSGLAAQKLGVRIPDNGDSGKWKVTSPQPPCRISEEKEILWLSIPSTSNPVPRRLRVRRQAG